MNCKICGNVLEFDDAFSYCKNCGFIAKKNQICSLEEKNRYLLHQDSSQYHMYLRQLYHDKFYEYEEILDFGSGQYLALQKSFSNFKITSYDFYFSKINYIDKMYDVIVLNEVIEHLSEPIKVLTELKKLLKPMGRFLIQTGLTDEISNIRNWWYTRDITHISFFHTKTFKYISSLLNLEYFKDDKFIILKHK